MPKDTTVAERPVAVAPVAAMAVEPVVDMPVWAKYARVSLNGEIIEVANEQGAAQVRMASNEFVLDPSEAGHLTMTVKSYEPFPYRGAVLTIADEATAVDYLVRGMCCGMATCDRGEVRSL